MSRFMAAEIAVAAGVASLCVVIAAQTLGFWNTSLQIPAAYNGDGLFYGIMIKGVIDSGWYMNNPWLGAPFGLDMGPFPMVDDTHFAIIKAVGQLTGNFGMTLTIFALASYATAAATAFFVMRLLGIGRVCSAVGAFLYSMQAYHFLRGGHLFLASYFSVPIFVGVAIFLYRTPAPCKLRWIAILGISVLLFVASSAGIYYTFFGSVLIGFASLASSIEQKRWLPLLIGGTIGIAIALSVFVNLAPHFASIRQQAGDQIITDRRPSESEIYGLRLIQMALPSPGHRRSTLSRLEQLYHHDAPNVNENSTASLGMLALGGFLLSILALLIHFKSAFATTLSRLGALNMVAFCFATIGGFGTIFAWLVSAQMRSLNRISIVIAFISLCALLLGIQNICQRITSNRTRQFTIAFMSLTLVIFGFWDQVPNWETFNFARANEIHFEMDRESGAAIQHILPADARVYQFPYVSFPESPPIFKEDSYGLARRYLHTKGIAWSYGAMRGSAGDQWIRTIESMPLPQRLSKLGASDFDAILVERAAYPDAGESIEKQISGILGEPALICPDKSCAVYLFENSGDPKPSPLLLAVRGNGFNAWERKSNGDEATESSGNEASRLFLLNPKKELVKARFRFDVTAREDSQFIVRREDADLIKIQMEAGQHHHFDYTILLAPGITTIMMSADPSRASNQSTAAFELSGIGVDAIDTLEQELAVQLADSQTLNCTGTLEFAGSAILNKYTHGFSQAEPTGRWSEGSSATLVCNRVDPNIKIAKLDASGLVTDTHSQHMVVSVNGGASKTVAFTTQSPLRTIEIPLPSATTEQLTFEFSFPEAASPAELGINSDPRKLAVFMYRMRFE